MANLIVTDKIDGCSVYGLQQVQYDVDGVSGKDFAAARTAAAFRQSAAIEQAASGFADVVRRRQQKLDELGTVLAVLAKAIASLTHDNPQGSDKSTTDSALTEASYTVARYGLTMTVTDDSRITRENAMKAQNNIQYALDIEDNDLQQDTVSLQSMLSKRDNAFSTAAKIVKKAMDASGATIGNIG